ncbi:MAG: AlpA family transcriptional regulator [Gammaproteobacteria bacterium]|nr:AlpA family transcriptional regulator [Gammaproteobacteria bacterium]MBU0770201.1 AlpA family transcriptional regulator [Gammaproteobacteria bacterium]MBU0857270.1 AlpA family transcriptional regulator [Gammaproteobacteria bacterium]MBU1846235.1 AlpA family transcriptional regulator [Gammaproteobacteria bacterium]
MEKIMNKAGRSLLAARPNNDTDANELHGMQLSRLVAMNTLPFRRTIRRPELRLIVPLADTTIYDMERRGEFPRRFNLTARCVVWDLTEVEAWLDARRQASDSSQLKRAPSPDVRQRKRRPVKAVLAS